MEKKTFFLLISAVLITVSCVAIIFCIIKSKRKTKEYAEYRKNKRNAVNRFYESETTKMIVDFIKQYPLPYEMDFYNSHIEIFYNGEKATYYFLANGIRSLSFIYLDKKSKCGKIQLRHCTYEHELLARAINRYFDNSYDFYLRSYDGNSSCLVGSLKDF